MVWIVGNGQKDNEGGVKNLEDLCTYSLAKAECPTPLEGYEHLVDDIRGPDPIQSSTISCWYGGIVAVKGGEVWQPTIQPYIETQSLALVLEKAFGGD